MDELPGMTGPAGVAYHFPKDSGEVMGNITALLPGQASSVRHLLSPLPALASSSATESEFVFILHLAFLFLHLKGIKRLWCSLFSYA